jgi:HEAT repeat protein
MDDIEHLIRQLRSGNRDDLRAVEALIQALTDHGSPLHKYAIEAIGKTNAPQTFFDALLQALDDHDDWRLREEAAWALGEIGNPKAGNRLLDLLTNDGVGDVIDVSRHALVKLGDKRIIPYLIANLASSQEYVRYDSARLLGGIGDETALPALEHLSKEHVIFHALEGDYDIGDVAREAAQQIRRRIRQNT